MCLQDFLKFHQRLFKILMKQSITEGSRMTLQDIKEIVNA